MANEKRKYCELECEIGNLTHLQTLTGLFAVISPSFESFYFYAEEE